MLNVLYLRNYFAINETNKLFMSFIRSMTFSPTVDILSFDSFFMHHCLNWFDKILPKLWKQVSICGVPFMFMTRHHYL